MANGKIVLQHIKEMTTLHLFQMESLKTDFQNLVQLQNDIIGKRGTLKTNLESLKVLYGNLVKQNNKKIFLFCLDSFYFQYKTLSVELDNIDRFITMINNRMYGDYYKLYNIILLETSKTDTQIQTLQNDFKKFTPYKELDPFHEYNKEEMELLHKKILSLLNHLYIKFIKKEQEIVEYGQITTQGMGVGNFMQTLSFETTIHKEQLLLYVNYLNFFHQSHEKYLKKLFVQIVSFMEEVEEDILKHNVSTQNTLLETSPLTKEMAQEKENKKKEIEDQLEILENNDIEINITEEQELSKQELPKQELPKLEIPKLEEPDQEENEPDHEENEKTEEPNQEENEKTEEPDHEGNDQEGNEPDQEGNEKTDVE